MHYKLKYIPALAAGVLLLLRCAHLKEARSLYEEGRYPGSITLCRQAIGKDSTDLKAYILLSKNYRAADSLTQALGTVRLAAARHLASPGLEAEKGRIYKAFGHRAEAEKDYPRALKHYRTARQALPDDTLLLSRTAGVTLRLGRLDETRTLLLTLADLDSDTARTSRRLAAVESRRASAALQTEKGITAFKSGRLAASLAFFSQARELRTDADTLNYFYHLAKGRDHYLKGRYTYKEGAIKHLWDAIDAFGLAASIFPDKAEPLYRMAMAYEKKDKDEYVNAIEAYEKALALEPEGPYASVCREQLGALLARKKKMDKFYGRDS